MSANDGPSFAFPDGVLAREVGGEMVLLSLQNEQYYGLDHVGARMVTRLTETSRDEAVAALSHDYEVDPAVLEKDLDRLVTELIAQGLLQKTDTSG
jgi:hypothetical protein